VVAVEAAEALDPKLGIPLTRLLVAATEARLEFGAAGAGAEGVYEGTRDALDVFFCKGGCWLGRARDDSDGFLRSCSVDDGCRSCDRLPEDLSTGRRDAAGLGMPERRGMAEGWSMAARNALDDAAGSVARNVSHPESKQNARRIATQTQDKHGASLSTICS
jgi:hypothetical protein